jgi:hypothetical protein
MNWLGERSVRDNAESEWNWEAFRAHRAKVSELLRAGAGPPSPRLCVLGAGNCNDLDLSALLDAYREVHLVDLDGEALSRGVGRQGLGDHPGIRRHGGVDVTGALAAMALWSPGAPIPDADLTDCTDAPARLVGPLLPGPFDVVASACLLSQLLRGVVLSAGEAHPRFLEALQAVRAGHLRLLAHLVAAGGSGLLVTDLVSSESFPALGSVPGGSLPGVLAGLVRGRNFFHGLNPAVLASLFRTDPVLAAEVDRPEPIPPWLWDLGPRVYAVCAFRFRKRGGGT